MLSEMMPCEYDADSSGAQLHDLLEEDGRQASIDSSSAVDDMADSQLKSIQAIPPSSSSSGAPWRLLRAIRLGASLRDKSAEWDCSSTYTGSVCSDNSGSDTETSPPDMKRQTSQPVLSKVARKPSVLHTFVKRAGLGLVRRSVSLCKIVSGTRVASSSGEDTPGDSYDCSSSTLSSSSSSSSVSVANIKLDQKPRRVLDAMRQAKNRLFKSLKLAKKHNERNAGNNDNCSDDRDVVSAYPTDSAPRTELNSYLSVSAIHSPEAYSSANMDDSSCETQVAAAIESVSGAGNDATSKYTPPKCPPYLGLHRRVADQAPVTTASNPFRQAPPPAALAATPLARLRPTQFKSQFTTLPYGAYAQLHQVQPR
ncbi:hypothetical protein IWW38_003310 [Coemansia aciculifera]|uniref:Uncharacterized protein n=1 Tax=Coemansia aciculifera TaxID=417176 RepID=A0ACC1M1I3_9FUNG|nr:hypothetical protein IWW38_003310 [Coemansia aciculifera]